MSTPNQHVDSNTQGYQEGPLGCDYKGKASISGISALIKETSREFPLPPEPREDMARRQPSMNEDVGPRKTVNLLAS